MELQRLLNGTFGRPAPRKPRPRYWECTMSCAKTGRTFCISKYTTKREALEDIAATDTTHTTCSPLRAVY